MIGQVTKEKLKTIEKIYYHGNCPDGLGAKLILRDIEMFRKLEFIPFFFQELSAIPEKAMFIDCSPKDEQMRAVLEKGGMIIEHHISRLAEIEELRKDFPDQLLYGEGTESGTWLALYLAELIGEEPCKDTKTIAEYLAISDTWQKDDPKFAYGRKLAGFLNTFGNELDIDHLGALVKYEGFIEAYAKVQRKLQESHARSCITHDVSRGKVAFINDTNLHISDASEILRGQGYFLIVGWALKSYNGLSRIQYSLRSDATFDVGAFCKAHGGGGHRAAAGFSVLYRLGKDPIQNFIDLLAGYQS